MFIFLRQVVSATFFHSFFSLLPPSVAAKCLFNIEARWKEEKKFNLFASCFGQTIVLHIAMSLGTYWKIVNIAAIVWDHQREC
jgi:hypothetical protein